jgi:antitoxin component YwqK of YwqJK toxin-antitoxin module
VPAPVVSPKPPEPLETITERYPGGSVKLQREMTLDAGGNYVNHGAYTEYDARGAVVRTGQFRQGKLVGPWTWVFRAGEAGLFSGSLDAQFQGPFVSEANFVDGKLHGPWTIADRDGQHVIEWGFDHGQRHGKSLWRHPNGQTRREVTYDRGKPAGEMVEWDANGKETSRIQFINGRALVRKVEWHAPGKKAYEGNYLVGIRSQESSFDWWNGTVQSSSSPGVPEWKHGLWTAWHPNGQKKAEGEYREDKPVGPFAWWYESGQKQAEGEYVEGVPSGVWITWHANGVKESRGEYRRGSAVGKWMRWNAEGRLSEAREFSLDSATDRDGEPASAPARDKDGAARRDPQLAPPVPR